MGLRSEGRRYPDVIDADQLARLFGCWRRDACSDVNLLRNAKSALGAL